LRPLNGSHFSTPSIITPISPRISRGLKLGTQVTKTNENAAFYFPKPPPAPFQFVAIAKPPD
jgi:hypothetical protein